MLSNLNKPLNVVLDERLIQLQKSAEIRTHGTPRANLGDNELIQLGTLVVRFQELESIMRLWYSITSTSNSEDLIKAMSKKYSYSEISTKLLSVIKEKYSNERDLIYVIERATEMNKVRNEIVHSSWGATGTRFRRDGKTISFSFEGVDDMISK